VRWRSGREKRWRSKLVEGHETVIRTARDLVSIAEAAGDVATADLATERIEVHEKTAWMLRATATDEEA
jgi:starvation-inducible DNA-binding protein